MRAIESGELFWQWAEAAGLRAVAIYQTGYLDTAIGQIVNHPRVAHVAKDDHSAIECDGFDDA